MTDFVVNLRPVHVLLRTNSAANLERAAKSSGFRFAERNLKFS